MSNKWHKLREGKGINCPICGHDHICMIGIDVVVCFRVKNGCCTYRDGTPVIMKGGMGWLHHLPKNGVNAAKLPKQEPAPKLTAKEWEELQRQCAGAITAEQVTTLAGELGVSEKSLRAFDLGWCQYYRSWSWPMRNAHGQIIGLRLRYAATGKKFAYPGSRNGLFVHNDYENYDPELLHSNPLLTVVPEGTTDPLAMYDLGFRTVGRPFCGSDPAMIVEWMVSQRKQDVVVLAHNDDWKFARDGQASKPGYVGGMRLASALRGKCARLRFLVPTVVKDVRQWLGTLNSIPEGTNRMINLIRAAPDVTAEWLAEQRRWYAAERAKAMAGHAKAEGEPKEQVAA